MFEGALQREIKVNFNSMSFCTSTLGYAFSSSQDAYYCGKQIRSKNNKKIFGEFQKGDHSIAITVVAIVQNNLEFIYIYNKYFHEITDFDNHRNFKFSCRKYLL